MGSITAITGGVFSLDRANVLRECLSSFDDKNILVVFPDNKIVRWVCRMFRNIETALNLRCEKTTAASVVVVWEGHRRGGEDLAAWCQLLLKEEKNIYITACLSTDQKFFFSSFAKHVLPNVDDIIHVPRRQPAFLTLITGPAFSGKTERCLEILNGGSGAAHRKKIIAIKHFVDNRHGGGSKKIVTHKNDTLNVDTFTTASLLTLLAKCYDKLDQADIIVIDKGHLFCDLAGFCEEVIKKKNPKQVYVTALISTHEKLMFPNVVQCIPLCHRIEFLRNVS